MKPLLFFRLGDDIEGGHQNKGIAYGVLWYTREYGRIVLGLLLL